MSGKIKDLDFYSSKLYGDNRDLILYAKSTDGFIKTEVSGCHLQRLNEVRRDLNIRAENGFIHVHIKGVAVFPLESLNPFGRFLYKLIAKLGFCKPKELTND